MAATVAIQGIAKMLDKPFCYSEYQGRHDEVTEPERLANAHVILLGPPCVGKTNVAKLVAQFRFRVACVRHVATMTPALTQALSNLPVVGITRSVDEVRKARFNAPDEYGTFHETRRIAFLDPVRIRDDLERFAQMCATNKWPLVDVTENDLVSGTKRTMRQVVKPVLRGIRTAYGDPRESKRIEVAAAAA